MEAKDVLVFTTPSVEGGAFSAIGSTWMYEYIDEEPVEYYNQSNQLCHGKRELYLKTINKLKEKAKNFVAERNCNCIVDFHPIQQMVKDPTLMYHHDNWEKIIAVHFTYGTLRIFKKVEKIKVFVSAPTFSYQFFPFSTETICLIANGVDEESIKEALRKIKENVVKLVTDMGYNCATNFNPDIKPYISATGEEKCLLTVTVQIGNVYALTKA